MKNVALYFVFIFTQLISIIHGDVDDIKVLPEEFYAVGNALNFTGKVVLISGSSSGIGATTARLFASLNARVVVTGRNGTRINAVVNDCHKLSPSKLRPLGLKLDFTIPGNIGRLVNETIKAYKKIDILVNCAGIGNFKTIQDPNYNKVYRELQTINVEAPMELTRLCAPYILHTKYQRIDYFYSEHFGEESGYSMGKNAIVSFANTVTHDLGPYVRVNTISSSNLSPRNFVSYNFARDLDKGLKTAKSESKPLILIVHKAFCGACRILIPKLTASDETKKLSDNFVMVNAYDGQEPNAKLYAPDGAYVPRIVFIRSDGVVLTQITNASIKGNEYKFYYQTSEDVVRPMKMAIKLNKK